MFYSLTFKPKTHASLAIKSLIPQINSNRELRDGKMIKHIWATLSSIGQLIVGLAPCMGLAYQL